MKLICVLGNIACGKSTFCKLLNNAFENNDIKSKLINLDEIGREIIQKKEIKKLIYAKFGIFSTNMDLAQIVFKNEKNQQTLNEITHPFIYEEFNKTINNYKSDNQIKIVIYEQTVYDGKTDKFANLADNRICVCADYNVRETRWINKGLDSKDFVNRNSLQINQETISNNCEIVVDNKKDEEYLKIQANKICDYYINLYNLKKQ